MNLKQFGVLIIMLSANSFFECTLFGDNFEPVYKVIFYMIFSFVALLVYVNKRKKKFNKLTYEKKQKVIDRCILILLFGLFLSLLNSFFFKDQGLLISIMTNIPMIIAYSSYFVFKNMNLTNIDESKIIVYLAIAYCVVFVLSVVTLPNPLFGTFEYEEMRGGFRLRIPGLFWVSLLFYYLLQKYKELGKYSILAKAFLLGLFIAASLARQYILWTTVLGIVSLMLNTKWNKKLFIMVFVILVGIFVVPKIPLVKNLKELSEMQKEQNDKGEEDVRLKDYQTFLIDYDRNFFQYIFGCGLGSQGNSKYGEELENMVKNDHLIQADAGWAGSVFYYGYFSTAVLLFLFLYCIFKTKKNYYKRFYLAYVALCAIGGGTIIYHHEILITMFVLSNIFKRDQSLDMSKCMLEKKEI